MAPRVLSDAELEVLTSWPSEVAHSDLVEYFTLDVGDLRWVRSHRGAAARLGLAVQLCGLRFLGFVPADLTTTPVEVTGRLAERVGVARLALARYVGDVDGRLRRLHVASVIERAGWRNCRPDERKRLADWLLSRALEHDDAPLLFALTLEHLRAERIVRPGLDRLLRSVGEARAAADKEVHWRLRPQLDAGKEKYRRHEDQTAQAHCLTLVVNICILAITWYLQDAVEAHRADGHEVSDDVITYISPGHFEALNPYGTHNIDVAAVLGRGHRRPLRRPAGG